MVLSNEEVLAHITKNSDQDSKFNTIASYKDGEN